MEETQTCHQCKETITGGELVKVEGQFFHVDHFHCNSCSKDLAGRQYIKHEDDFFCPTCYSEKHAPKCTTCSKPIEGKYLNIDNNPFHNECFTCHECSNPIPQQYYKIEGSNNYQCKSCKAKSSPVCFECKNPILTEKIATMGKHWHNTCFVCCVCKKDIGDDEVTAKDERPCHVACMQQTCVICQLKIQSEVYMEAGGKSYHIDCHQNNETQGQEKNEDHAEKIKQQQEDEERSRREEINREIEQKQQEERRAQQEANQKKQEAEEKKKESPNKVSNESPTKKEEKQEESSGPQTVIDSSRPRHPYDQLKINPPVVEGIDVTQKQYYLSDDEFRNIFKMSITEFYDLKKWKQDELKKKVLLF